MIKWVGKRKSFAREILAEFFMPFSCAGAEEKQCFLDSEERRNKQYSRGAAGASPQD
jgi:hypothetical protein